MVDSYQGNLKLKGEARMMKKRHMGVLMIEDDKIIFMYNNNDNIKEITFEEMSDIISPHHLSGSEIVLKDGRSFILYINPGSNWSSLGLQISGNQVGSLMSQIDHNKRIKQANQLVFKTLTYLLKKIEQ